MTSAIEDVSSLPGKKLKDQEGQDIGEIKEIFAHGGDGDPMWVTVDAKHGMGKGHRAFVPLARLKQEGDDIGVPYSADHIRNCPQIEGGDDISAEDDRLLRDHYGIGRADQELRSDHSSYATLVPADGEIAGAKKVDDPGTVETPDADRRDEETRKRLEDPGSSEIRHVAFGDDDEGGGGQEGEGKAGGGQEGERAN